MREKREEMKEWQGLVIAAVLLFLMVLVQNCPAVT
jgi:hypothetical protein